VVNFEISSCTKFHIFRPGFAPDPAGGASSAPPPQTPQLVGRVLAVEPPPQEPHPALGPSALYVREKISPTQNKFGLTPLSVTRADQSKTDEVTIVQFSPYSSPHSFYRAMNFSAKRGLAIATRPSVYPPVRL